MNKETFQLLEHFGFTVNTSNEGELINITKHQKIGRIFGLIVSILGVLICISGILYLLLYEEIGFHPLLFRFLLSIGIILGVLGFSLKSRNKENDIHFDLKNQTLTFGQNKNQNTHMRYTYRFSELSNPEVMKYGPNYVLIVQIGTDKSILFKLKNDVESLKTLKLILEELRKIIE